MVLASKVLGFVFCKTTLLIVVFEYAKIYLLKNLCVYMALYEITVDIFKSLL